jgi:hypothetical protein
MDKISKLLFYTLPLLFAVASPFAQAQPVMQAGEWKVSIKGETVDSKTGKRAPVGSNSTVTICLTRDFLDGMGFLSPSVKSQQKMLSRVDASLCRSAVSEMSTGSMKLYMHCNLPNGQSAELDYRFAAENKRYRATNRATRSDGLAAVEGTIDGEFVGECSETTMAKGKDLPPLLDPPKLPLIKPAPVQLDGETFHFVELSNREASYENAYTPLGQNVKNFVKYFAVSLYRDVSLESFLAAQTQHADKMKVKGAPQAKVIEHTDGRHVFFFPSRLNDKVFEMNVFIAKASDDNNTMLTQYVMRLDLPYSKHQAMIEKKREAWMAELLAIGIPVLTHADFSATLSRAK